MGMLHAGPPGRMSGHFLNINADRHTHTYYSITYVHTPVAILAQGVVGSACSADPLKSESSSHALALLALRINCWPSKSKCLWPTTVTQYMTIQDNTTIQYHTAHYIHLTHGMYAAHMHVCSTLVEHPFITNLGAALYHALCVACPNAAPVLLAANI